MIPVYMHVNSMMCTPVYVDQGEKVVVVVVMSKIDRQARSSDDKQVRNGKRERRGGNMTIKDTP